MQLRFHRRCDRHPSHQHFCSSLVPMLVSQPPPTSAIFPLFLCTCCLYAPTPTPKCCCSCLFRACLPLKTLVAIGKTRVSDLPLAEYNLLYSATGIHSSLGLSTTMIRPDRCRYRRGAQVRKALCLIFPSNWIDWPHKVKIAQREATTSLRACLLKISKNSQEICCARDVVEK